MGFEPAWVVAAVAVGGVVATGAIAYSNASRVEGLEGRLRAVEVEVAVLKAHVPQHGGGD